MWAWDMWKVVDYLQTRKDIDKDNISIYGYKQLRYAAVIATAVDERIKAVFAEQMCPTYVCRKGYGRAYIYKGDNSNLGGLGYISPDIPEIMLRVGDIPIIMTMIAPGKLTLINPLWADGTPMSASDAAQTLDNPRKAWQLFEKPENINLIAGAPTKTIQQCILEK